MSYWNTMLRIGIGSRLAVVFKQFKEHKIAMVGAVLILFLAFIAIFAPHIAPHDPIEINLKERLLAPNMEYPLGTDNLGRCMLSRIIYGTRVSLRIGIMVVGITSALGITLGTGMAAIITRLTRSSMLEVLRQDYITPARAKGLREKVIIWKHALKNGIFPVVTVIVLQFGWAVQVDVIF